jgi:biopolymer transport protein ExbB/TolQ
MEHNIYIWAVIFIAFWQLRALYKKNRILRHQLITMCDWSGDIVDEISKDAIQTIVDLKRAIAPEMTEEEAKNSVPYTVLEGTKAWNERMDDLEGRLKRNGISMVNLDDKRLPISVGWYK